MFSKGIILGLKEIEKKPLLKVASVLKPHGIKGEIFVRLQNPCADWPDSIKEIAIGEAAYSVQKYSCHKKGIIFKLKGCESLQEAEALRGQPVFLSQKIFQSKKGEGIYLSELASFHVGFVQSKRTGIVQSFQSHANRDFLQVQLKGGKQTVLIPFVKAYIQDIDFSKKKLTLNLPDNFLELFAS